MQQTQSSVDMALLVERMNRMLSQTEGLGESIRSIHKRLDAIPLIERDIEILEEQTVRLFQAQSLIKDVMNTQGNVVSTHSLIWKLCGAIASLCTASLIAFGYNTIQSVHTQEAILDRRMSIIEFQLRGMPYAAKIKD